MRSDNVTFDSGLPLGEMDWAHWGDVCGLVGELAIANERVELSRALELLASNV